MATIPTYRDLEDRIEVLEGKLRYWSNLSNLNADESLASIINSNQEQVVADIKSLCKKAFEGDEGGLSSFDSIEQGMKEAIEWNEEDKEGM